MIQDTYTEIAEFVNSLKSIRHVRATGGSSVVGAGEMYGHANVGMGFGGMQNFGMPIQQYAANKDTVFSSIFPGAIKCSSQAWGFGYTKEHKIRTTKGQQKEIIQLKDLMPPSISKSMSKKDVFPLEGHPIESLFEEPNDLLDGWATLYCTYFSISLTGRSYWLINMNPETKSGLELFYMPTHWVRPIPGDSMRYRIQPSTTAGFEVDASQIISFILPNPANPIEGYSNLQSQARAVNIEDKILEAQFESMENSIYPSVILKAGRLPDMKGLASTQGQMPILEPEQRQRLITAVKLATAGPANHREPFIVDGMIEDIIPYTHTTADMDFTNGSTLTKERIMSGFGTNRYVTGEIDNVNKSTAVVAEDHNNSLQVNPIIDLISRAVNRRISPFFSGETSKLVVWLEKAIAEDQESLQDRFSLAPIEHLFTKGQIKKYVATGKLEITDDPDDDKTLAEIEEERAEAERQREMKEQRRLMAEEAKRNARERSGDNESV